MIDEAEKLKAELEEEKKENERLAKLEEERVEREAATEELQGAITAAKESRDASTLSKPIKRAKKVRLRTLATAASQRYLFATWPLPRSLFHLLAVHPVRRTRWPARGTNWPPRPAPHLTALPTSP